MKKTIITFLFAAMITALSAGLAYAASYYVCGCGPQCDCGCMSSEAGKCCCGKEMVELNLISMEDGVAKFCSCGGGCACGISADDPNMCKCGKPVKAVGLKGKYVCGCGPDCSCGAISEKPGNCGCGKPLKLVE